MKSSILLVLIFPLLAIISCFAQKQNGYETPSLSYQLKPVTAADRTNLEISLHLAVSGSAPVKIGLPTDCFGIPNLDRSVTSFAADNGSTLEPVEKPEERMVRPSPSGIVSVHYVMSYDPINMENFPYSPNTSAHHFHVAGCQWLLHVGSDTEKRTFSVSIVDAPKNWKLYASAAPDPTKFEIVSDWEDLASSGIGGGEQARFFKIGGKPVSVFLNGVFDIPSSELFSAVERIIRLERNWFNDYDQPFYDIVISRRGDFIAGYAPENGFFCFVRKDISRDQLNVLLAHELFHNWLPNKLRIRQEKGFSSVRFEWFSEGFTDYFARKILLEAKLLTAQKFAELVNQDIYNIADNPHSRDTYIDLVAAIKSGKYMTAYKKLSYYRGALIALNWDTQIRRDGEKRDLSDFIRDLYLIAAKTNGEISEQAFYEFAGRYKLDARSDLERFITKGGQIPIPPDGLGLGFGLINVERPSFDPGFSLDETFKTRTISGVVESGPAYNAGLRSGMAFVDIINSNRFGNGWQADKPMTVVVKSNGKEAEQRISFFPHGPALKLELYQAK
jgi:predicted metalloprotease with PDZ domain